MAWRASVRMAISSVELSPRTRASDRRTWSDGHGPPKFHAAPSILDM